MNATDSLWSLFIIININIEWMKWYETNKYVTCDPTKARIIHHIQRLNYAYEQFLFWETDFFKILQINDLICFLVRFFYCFCTLIPLLDAGGIIENDELCVVYSVMSNPLMIICRYISMNMAKAIVNKLLNRVYNCNTNCRFTS